MTQPLKWVARARGVYLSLAGLALHLHRLAGLALHLAGLSVHSSCVFSFFSPNQVNQWLQLRLFITKTAIKRFAMFHPWMLFKNEKMSSEEGIYKSQSRQSNMS